MAGHTPVTSSRDIAEIAYHVRNVKCKRSLGLLLNIETKKLDHFEKDPFNTVSMIIEEWFRQTPMTIQERWEELGRVLLEPALNEVALAKQLQPRVRRGSSIDSAISELSSISITSPVDAPVDATPVQYQMSYIGKFY